MNIIGEVCCHPCENCVKTDGDMALRRQIFLITETSGWQAIFSHYFAAMNSFIDELKQCLRCHSPHDYSSNHNRFQLFLTPWSLMECQNEGKNSLDNKQWKIMTKIRFTFIVSTSVHRCSSFIVAFYWWLVIEYNELKETRVTKVCLEQQGQIL